MARNIIIISLILSQIVLAQGNRKYVDNKMFWTEINFTGKIKNKFGYQVDYQYRRAADAATINGGEHVNLFKNPLQQVLRPWISYKINGDMKLSLSPLGWWGNWSGGATGYTFTPELRITGQLISNQKLSRIVISHRYRYEFRLFGSKSSAANGFDFDGGYTGFTDDSHKKSRFRYFLRAVIPLNHATLEPKTFYTNTYNEIFINIGKNIKNTNLFDQNRLFLGLGYKFENIRIEMGYLRQHVFRFNNVEQNNVDRNHVFQMFIIFDDVSSTFRLKKKSRTATIPVEEKK